MKKLLGTLFLVLLFAGCDQEVNTQESMLPPVQQLNPGKNYLDGYLARASDLVTNLNTNAQSAQERFSLANLQLDEAISARRQFRIEQGTALKDKPKEGEIQVPQDYPTLQEAIDNSEPDGKIKVKGDLAFAEGYILVDVPGLQIEGEGKASVSGSFLILIEDNVTINKLDLDIVLVIAPQAAGAQILKNSFTPSVNTTNFSGVAILMIGASDCMLKDNDITDKKGNLHWGILGSDCQNNSFISNTISGGPATEGHIELYQSAPDQGTRNNVIKDCKLISGGVAVGGSALRITGARSGNVISGCSVKNVAYNGIILQGNNNLLGPILGNDNQIVDCDVQNYAGFGIRMENESHGLISKCKVNNKKGDSEETLGSEGIGLFGTDGTIVDCSSSSNNGGGIVVFGNPFGTGSSNAILNCKANDNRYFGIFYFGGGEENATAVIKDCEANNNTDLDNWGSILLQSTGTSSTYTISKCKINDNAGACSAGLVAYADPGFSANWIIEDNDISKNFVGIYLENATMATLSHNKAKKNSRCDLDQVNTSGTVLQSNQFERSCIDQTCD
ncbi:MAG: right-handed parallel beta-helix repeat-containing protein [Maribacter sp.]|nr:right-handed parallel beta-helix repeat-containing protein [Maribacter sp.]